MTSSPSSSQYYLSEIYHHPTDTFQLTKVQESIRQLSARCESDSHTIALLKTENKVLKEDVVNLEQLVGLVSSSILLKKILFRKLQSCQRAKSLAERNCAQLEVKISAIE